MKDVLIVGGNRFVGKLVAEKLQSEYNVTVMNRSGTAPTRCDIIQCDRNDEEKFADVMEHKSFHCVVDMCLYNKEQAEITSKILDGKTSKYIYISSVAVYNKSGIFPITEDFPTGEWEEWGDYGREKREVEEEISKSSLPYICLRPTYIVGKGDPHKRLDQPFPFIDDSIISLVFVDDVAEIICKFVESDIERETYNIASDHYIKQSEFVWLSPNSDHTMNSPFPVKDVIVSNQQVKRVLNYKFRPLIERLEEYYEISKS